ncbi:hypothetical protein RYA05_04835 [Pseudomonas syringae pv. actinidiae]|nr:hypothetical protein [Pseudomonas syringae pv. actinidiae]
MEKLRRRRIEIPVFKIDGDLISTYHAAFGPGDITIHERFLEDDFINKMADISPVDFDLIVEDEHQKKVTMRINARTCKTEFKLMNCLREILGDAEDEGLPRDSVSVVDMVRFDEEGNLLVRMTQNENPVDDRFCF